MLKDAMTEIRAAEEEAQQIRAKAQTEAKQCVEMARQKGKAALEEAEAQADLCCREALQKANGQAEKRISDAETGAENDRAALRCAMREHEAEAVRAIAESVVKQWQ